MAPDAPVTEAHALPFCALGLDRAIERLDDAAWVAGREAASDTRFMLLDGRGRLYVDAATGAPHWLDGAARAQLLPQVPASLLGLAGGHAWFVLHVAADAAMPAAMAGPQTRWMDLREAGATLDPFTAGLFAYALGLANWQGATRFCPACGAPLEPVSAGHRLHCTGPACGRMHFPRTDPAIIVIVEHAGACLLGRQASWPRARYSTLAGFVEPGETLEAAVRREVFEEAGIEVGACRYHASQPWPFPASLMVGFMASARTSRIVLRDGELEDARWFTPEDIVAAIGDGSFVASSRVSISWRLLADWMRERSGIDLAALTANAR